VIVENGKFRGTSAGEFVKRTRFEEFGNRVIG
jgi:hypothetical protein